MDIFDSYKRRVGNYSTNTPNYNGKYFNGNSSYTLGSEYKYESDAIMEETWWNDPQSKICYIYDYYHDDQPDLNIGMTYNGTTKTRIDAKFMIKTHGSMSKDQVEVHIMFKPSQKYNFVQSDSLYYLEENYRQKYKIPDPFIGCYIDIPNQNGIYEKWLICLRDTRTQFQKYFVLPCDYHLHWIEDNGEQRIKRKMWCVTRNQNSYNSGLWRDYYFTSMENQNKLILPLNPISEGIYYTSTNEGTRHNQRLIVSALVKNPTVWNVSKVENTNPIGLQRLTIKQDDFNTETDYVNLDTGEMYADYYYSTIEPIADETNMEMFDHYITQDVSCNIKCSTYNIKSGGSFKLLTAKFVDSHDNDITENYINNLTWRFYIDDEEIFDGDYLTVKAQDLSNQIKIKIANKREFLGKSIKIVCSSNEIIGETNLEIIAI